MVRVSMGNEEVIDVLTPDSSFLQLGKNTRTEHGDVVVHFKYSFIAILVHCYCNVLSGCWPSWAFHAHSVIFISEKVAVKDDSSGEQA